MGHNQISTVDAFIQSFINCLDATKLDLQDTRWNFAAGGSQRQFGSNVVQLRVSNYVSPVSKVPAPQLVYHPFKNMVVGERHDRRLLYPG